MRGRIDPETHPVRLIPVIDDVCVSVGKMQKAAPTADPEELREMLVKTLDALQTTAGCVAALTRRVGRARL